MLLCAWLECLPFNYFRLTVHVFVRVVTAIAPGLLNQVSMRRGFKAQGSFQVFFWAFAFDNFPQSRRRPGRYMPVASLGQVSCVYLPRRLERFPPSRSVQRALLITVVRASKQSCTLFDFSDQLIPYEEVTSFSLTEEGVAPDLSEAPCAKHW